jgi:putative ABC transport system ATP-binding protein
MIELKNITKKYKVNNSNTVVALEDINIDIKPSQLIVLKGISGSGKSTILSLIAALTKPTNGEVIVNNQRVSKLPDKFASIYRRESIGFIFQKYNLIPSLTVKENIILPSIPSNPSLDILEKNLQKVMEKFNILHKENIMVKNLSGGEQQRVAIARSMINDPAIILADEPTANLDEKLSKEFIDILHKLKDEGKTIVVATHDPLFFDLDFVDKTINIKNGKLLDI